ncbi:hypothetical protein BGZ94_008090 [Podila epigama]|nr:hypothetical protein BGZ94_008090 [Podila epigama]
MAFDIREEDEERRYNDDEFEEYEDIKQPERPKFWRRKKFWMFCIPNAIIGIIIAVVLALYVIMPKIAQSLMDKSTIELTQIDITNPSTTGMDIVMLGKMKDTGPFHATISFPETVTVFWNEKELGTTIIPGTSEASGGSGDLDLKSSFVITNEAAFTEFSSYMLNAESFEWQLVGKLNVKALGHTVKNLNLDKKIAVQAFNGLSGIKIEKFSLPGDDPAGKGILIEIDTAVTNPSAIQMYMGSLTLAISYKDTVMGYVTSSGLTMMRGAQTLSMKGVLVAQNTPEGLAVISEMMSRYCSNLATDTIATGFEVKPDGATSVPWLSAAVKNLKLTVPLQSPTPLQLIKALNLGALGLTFTPPTAYEPVTTSTGVIANYGLPDGFNFNIQFNQVANAFALSRGGVVIANLNSSYNPSTSDMAAGTLTFNLLQTPLVVPEPSHSAFQEFNRDLTTGSNLPFQVTGFASVYANTSIGVVNLVNIPFNATTELSGLQSLANPAPTITALQVVAGSANDMTLAITVVIINPSSISLSAGDVVLDLVYQGVRQGTVTMPNLSLVPGANTVEAVAIIDPRTSPEGLDMLNKYTSGAGATVSIVGTPSSTAVDSLSLAFGALNIDSQMPGLETKLLAGASLVVLDTTLVNGLAQTIVKINNPFVPDMTILSIDSTITYNGVALGTVVASFSTPPIIPGVGQGELTASLAMNTNPHDLVTLIRAQAVLNGLDTTAFDGLLELQAGGNPPASIFDGFNVADFTVKAMAGLSVDITLTTTVKVGDYEVTIPYVQNGVPTATDQTILKLIPVVGTPIAQLLVDGSTLNFDSIKILAPGEDSFTTDINGMIAKTGPLDAQISFPNPVTVSFGGKTIGSMSMPTVNAIANQGAVLNLTGVAFTILDKAAYTDFTVYALTNAKFDWTIATTGLVVNAMGASLPGVSMTKTVTLDGFDSLAGLKLLSYIIDDVDANGMHLTIASELANPSTIGMTIPQSVFETIAHGKVLGPAIANDMTLIPHSTSTFVLKATIATGNGNMVPYLAAIFGNAVSGVFTDLEAQGVGAPGVSWLDAAIKQLRLHTQLPPLPEDPIESVEINAMSMDFACQTCVWNPMAASSITAKTRLPFAKGAPIVELQQDIDVLDKNGNRVGRLLTAWSEANATGPFVSTTTLEAPLKIYDDAHDTYIQFINDLNFATKYNLGLRGTANSKLNLGDLGIVPVMGIKLDVVANLDGLQGLADVKFLNLIAMKPFAPNQGAINLVTIHNPSKLTLKIGDLALSTGQYDTLEAVCGVSVIKDLVLVPGDNPVVADTTVDTSLPAGQELMLKFTEPTPTTLYLRPFQGTVSNPALDAGLQNLRQVLQLPPFLIGNMSTTPYTRQWSLDCPASSVTDGICFAKTTVGNPFYNMKINVLSVDSTELEPWAGPSTMLLGHEQNGGVRMLKIFDFIPPNGYTLNGYETKEVAFPVQFNPEAFTDVAVNDWVNNGNSGTSVKLQIQMTALALLGSIPDLTAQYWWSEYLFMDPNDANNPSPPPVYIDMTLGPNFVNIQTYMNQSLHGPAPSPPVLSPSPTLVTPSPSVAPSPSPAPSATPVPSPSPSPSPLPQPSVPVTEEPVVSPSPVAPLPQPNRGGRLNTR